MNWPRIAASLVLPLLVAVPIAALFWRRRQAGLGAVIGAGILLVGALVFGGLEYVDAIRYRLECARLNLPCRVSNPSDFVKTSVYAIVAMGQVMMLFVMTSIVEKRLERGHYDPGWR